jgi:hypothetical protein
VTRGTVHNYLGMVLDFSSPPYVSISQVGMIGDIIRKARESPTMKIPTASPKSLATEQLFEVSPDSPPLTEKAQANFHSILASFNFIGGRGRPDLIPYLAAGLKRVLAPTEEDERKAARFVGYVESTRNLTLRLRCYLPPKISAFIDASFATHPNMRSHSGVCLTMGVGAFYSKSTAQKLNSTSSCHAEMVALAKCMQQGLWSKYFIEDQGYPPSPITAFQDNQSTIKLMENGRPTSGLSRHIRIGYFWVHNLILKKVIKMVYCPTEFMIADIMIKPLQESLFRTMRDRIMGIVRCPMVEESTYPKTPHTRIQVPHIEPNRGLWTEFQEFFIFTE